MTSEEASQLNAEIFVPKSDEHIANLKKFFAREKAAQNRPTEEGKQVTEAEAVQGSPPAKIRVHRPPRRARTE